MNENYATFEEVIEYFVEESGLSEADILNEKNNFWITWSDFVSANKSGNVKVPSSKETIKKYYGGTPSEISEAVAFEGKNALLERVAIEGIKSAVQCSSGTTHLLKVKEMLEKENGRALNESEKFHLGIQAVKSGLIKNAYSI